MTLDQYKVDIIAKLKKLNNKEYENSEEHLGALNSLSETIHHALKDYGDDQLLINLNKYVILAIIIMELAVDYGIIDITNNII